MTAVKRLHSGIQRQHSFVGREEWCVPNGLLLQYFAFPHKQGAQYRIEVTLPCLHFTCNQVLTLFQRIRQTVL